VIADNAFKLIESLAILEYLELKYPHPSLSGESSLKEIAKTKMIQMVIVNELVPKLLSPLYQYREGFENIIVG
jgi:glutathione S-transferase